MIECLKEYLSIYIHSKEILLKSIYYNRQIIYCQNDLKIINKRIINIKSKIQKENIYAMSYIKKLQNGKDNIEKYTKYKNQLELQLSSQIEYKKIF